MDRILPFSVSEAGFCANLSLHRVSIVHNVAFLCGNSDAQVKCVVDLSTNCSDCARAQQSLLSFRPDLEPVS